MGSAGRPWSERRRVLLGLALAGIVATGFWSRSQTQGHQCLTSIQQEALVHLDGITPHGTDRETIRSAALVHAALVQTESRLSQGIDVGGLPASQFQGDVAVALDDIARMRDVTAWEASSPALTRSLLVLADAHQQRLEQMLQRGSTPLEASTDECPAESVDRLWQRVLRWSGSPRK